MATTHIGDLVEANLGGGFRSDVVLGSYRRQRDNLDLARSYIFTGRAPAGKHASAALVRCVAESLLPGEQSNRFVVIATYGHGKSHFAVALANYFGQPADSPAGAAVLANLEHALHDEPVSYGWLADFKRNHRPFLVLLLRGDEPSDLATKFFRGLDDALAAEPAAAGRAPSFWFDGVERWLDKIDPNKREEVDAFLQQYHLDLDLLLDKVGAREVGTYEVCRQLHLHLHGSLPDFGATTSLEKAIIRVVDELCGSSGPFGGLLVLFDEFSAFVRDYAALAGSRPGMPLQDLLNGIKCKRERAAFVGFAQRDPDTVALKEMPQLPQATIDNLKKELSRLEMKDRLLLHSSLENVLDSYLKQNETAWGHLMSINSGFRSAVYSAIDESLKVFRARYATELGWSRKDFESVVASGCFPLHPMTTGLLCSVELESLGAGAARTVLGFVKEMLDSLRDEPVVRDQRPNWVLPIALVEYFREMLGEEHWSLYRAALDAAGGADTPADERAVLQALLLLRAADPPTREVGFDRVVGQFAGMSREAAAATIRRLATRGIVQLDPTTGRATFWSGGKTGQGVEKLLAEKLVGHSLTPPVLDAITSILSKRGLLASRGVSVGWGSTEDWSVPQVLVSRALLTAEALRAWEDRLHWRLNGLDYERGVLLWAVAETDDDVEWFRAEMPALLMQAYAERPVPIVVMTPRHPNPTLARLLLRAWGLDRFTNTERTSVGQEQFEQVRDTTDKLLREELQRLLDFDSAIAEVAPALRLSIQATRPTTIASLLNQVFPLAYAQGPGTFFTAMKATNPSFRKSVARVANLLLKDGLGLPAVLDGFKQAQDIANLLTNQWGLVDGNKSLRIPAATSRLRRGWDELSNYFAAGSSSKPVRPVLEQLLSPPWGYDYNTLMLLFCGWFGYHRNDLEVSKGGQLASMERLAKDTKSGDFLTSDKFWLVLTDVSLKRRAIDILEGQVRVIIQRIEHEEITSEQAEDHLVTLAQFISNPRAQAGLRALADQYRPRLEKARDDAATYDREAAKLLKDVSNERALPRLCDALTRLGKLPPLSGVRPTQPPLVDIRAMIIARIGEQTEAHTAQKEQLSRLEDYTLHQQYLQGMRSSLTRVDLPELIKRVDQALQRLETKKGDLEQRQHDAVKLAEVRSMATTGSLDALRRAAERLGELTFATDEGKRAQQTKATQLATAIHHLETQVRAHAEAVGTAATSKQLGNARDNLLKLQQIVSDAAEAAVVDAALARCERLQTYQADIAAASGVTLRVPADAERALSALAELPDRYAGDVGEAQRQWATAAAETVRRAVGQREREALAWLRQCERDANDQGQLLEVQERLRKPDAFLPSSERERLATLRAKVQQRLDAHAEVQVVGLFKRIADPARRRACLEQLRRLAEELEHA